VALFQGPNSSHNPRRTTTSVQHRSASACHALSQNTHFEALRALALAVRTHDVPCHHSLCILLKSLPDTYWSVYFPVSVTTTEQRPVSHAHRCIVFSLSSALHFAERCQWILLWPESLYVASLYEIYSSKSLQKCFVNGCPATSRLHPPHSLALKEALPDCSVLTTVSAMSSRPFRVAQGYHR
jgi:hypothetical protein